MRMVDADGEMLLLSKVLKWWRQWVCFCFWPVEIRS